MQASDQGHQGRQEALRTSQSRKRCQKRCCTCEKNGFSRVCRNSFGLELGDEGFQTHLLLSICEDAGTLEVVEAVHLPEATMKLSRKVP